MSLDPFVTGIGTDQIVSYGDEDDSRSGTLTASPVVRFNPVQWKDMGCKLEAALCGLVRASSLFLA